MAIGWTVAASRFRKLGLNAQLCDFLLTLSGALNPQSLLAVSVPASEMEMMAEDVADYTIGIAMPPA